MLIVDKQKTEAWMGFAESHEMACAGRPEINRIVKTPAKAPHARGNHIATIPHDDYQPAGREQHGDVFDSLKAWSLGDEISRIASLPQEGRQPLSERFHQECVGR